MNVKKILIILAVVISGIMIGVFLGISFPEKKESTSASSDTDFTEEEDQRDGLTANLVISPKEIEATDPEIDFENEVDKIKTSILTITYTNVSENNLSGVEVWVNVTGGDDYGFLTSTDAKFVRRNPIDPKTNSEDTILKISDIGSNQTQSADIYFYSKKPNKISIFAKIVTAQGKTAKTNSANLVIN